MIERITKEHMEMQELARYPLIDIVWTPLLIANYLLVHLIGGRE